MMYLCVPKRRQLIRRPPGLRPIAEEDYLACKVDLNGFSPEEIHVECSGGELVLQGKQFAEGPSGEPVCIRSLDKRLRIPDGLIKESVQCDVDDEGRLLITGRKVTKKTHRFLPRGFLFNL
ncbi:hypothetical protein AAVH_16433 [Aphelenchoides avenae]|nr:hypothetical protein AAVH_40109 [Aphelenchus avenae]KAH7693196.1 hypothetical protein AAVH_39773 [Aphelenchus avenae]KAH7716173.1 hypothetical protein AAVH_16433 [Aphelenchus avenae]